MLARYMFPVPRATADTVYMCENAAAPAIPDALRHIAGAKHIVYYYLGLDPNVPVPACDTFTVKAASSAPHAIQLSYQTARPKLVLEGCSLLNPLPTNAPHITLRKCRDFTHPIKADTIELARCTNPPTALVQARRRLILNQVTFTADDTVIETGAHVRVLACKGKLTLKCGPVVYLAQIASVPTLVNPVRALAIIHCDEIFPSASRVLEKYVQAEVVYYAASTAQNIVCGQGGKQLRVLALQDIGPARCVMNCPSLQTLILVHAAVERLQVTPTKGIWLYGLESRIPEKVPRRAFLSTAEWSKDMLEETGALFEELQAAW